LTHDDEIEELRSQFDSRRWPSLVESSEKHDVDPPNKEALWQVVLQNYKNGFKCEYCGRKLKTRDSEFPHSRSFSIDHNVSLFLDGDNRISNFVVCCTACNQIKSTATGGVYQKVVDAILEKHGRDLLDKWHKQMQVGQIAKKLEREERLDG